MIEQAEIGNRGFYTGVFGIFDGHDVDSAVAIRFVEKDSDMVYYRSGGGITASSILDNEYQELINKIYVPTNRKYLD
jgi:para-aminobenzoate synthetase component 1